MPLSADILGQKLHVAYDAAVLDATRIVDAVAETGMRAWLEHEAPVVPPTSDHGARRLLAGRRRRRVRAVAAVHDRRGAGRDCRSSLLAIALAGIEPARKAWTSLRRRSLDIHVLMVVAVAGAMAIGEWAEGATVVCLFAVAQWLEVRTMERARDAIREVIDAGAYRGARQERPPRAPHAGGSRGHRRDHRRASGREDSRSTA